MDATGAQMYVQAKACAHQRAKSRERLFVMPEIIIILLLFRNLFISIMLQLFYIIMFLYGKVCKKCEVYYYEEELG